MSKLNKAVDEWQRHCGEIAAATSIDAREDKSVQAARVERARRDYAYFVEYYFPHFAKCACGRFQVETANLVLRQKNLKAVLMWARAHAKSTHLDVFVPMWLKCQRRREINVAVVVGKSQDNANTLLGDVQAELQYNRRYAHDFGAQYNAGHWTDGEFVTEDGVAFFARGRGQSPRGLRYRDNRPDYIVTDDLDDDELCRNPARVSSLTDWVKEALFGALDGGRGRFLMAGNLISKTSVLARIAATEGVHVSRVNVRNERGEVTWKEKWSRREVDEMERFMGYRSFQKEYMNNPITEGAVFRNEWIRWAKLPDRRSYRDIVAYCDPSFKSGAKNDYKAVKVWGSRDAELHNLENFVRQCSVAEMVRWFYDLHEKMESDGVICNYYMEANFLQDIILDEFEREGKQRGYQLPIRPDTRKKPDKFQRIESISPLWERGFVLYDERLRDDPDTKAGIDQLLAVEKGSNAHDDAPDADEGAIYILRKRGRAEAFPPRFGRRNPPRYSW